MIYAHPFVRIHYLCNNFGIVFPCMEDSRGTLSYFVVIQQAEVAPLSFWKRLSALLFCLFLLPCSTSQAESPSAYLPQLDVLDQHDPRMEQAAYVYQGKTFWQNGCQPSSIANAITASMGDAGTDASAVLLDVLNLAAPFSGDRRTQVSLGNMFYMVSGKRNDHYPTLNSLMDSVAALERPEDWTDVAAVIAQAQTHSGTRFTFIGRMTLKTHWEVFVQLMYALNDAGFGQMRLGIGSVGVGTSTTSAPFRSEQQYGHYVALFLQVDEFCATGTLYMLDSSPRALAEEPIGEDCRYRYRYDFCEERYQRTFTKFNGIYQVSRLTPTLLRLDLTAEALEALTCAAPEELVSLRVSQLSPLQFYGTGLLVLTNP